MGLYRIVNDVVKMRAISEIRNLQTDSAVIEVIIQPEKTTRGARANRYYWAVLNCIASFAGESSEYLHEECKERYLTPQIVESKSGKKKHAVYSTKKLNTKEFAEYLEKVIAVGHRLDLKIPHPDDQYHDQFLAEYGRNAA